MALRHLQTQDTLFAERANGKSGNSAAINATRQSDHEALLFEAGQGFADRGRDALGFHLAIEFQEFSGELLFGHSKKTAWCTGKDMTVGKD
jgi:hypothetical protein